MGQAQVSQRLIAFVIDGLVFLALAIALVYPLTLIDPDRFRIGSPLPEFASSSTIRSSEGDTTGQISGTWIAATCVAPKPVPEALAATIAPQEPERVLLCSETFLGLGGAHYAIIDYFKAGRTQTGMQGDMTITVTKRGPPARLTVTTDAQGAPLRALYPVGILTFGLMWLVAALGWPTPGKLVTGLRVQSDGGTCRTCRETRRLAPFLLAGLFALVTGFFGAEIAARETLATVVLAARVGFWLFAVWYYVLPLLPDGGEARYDTATGFRVGLA
ncbi:MAG: hypothetical protein MUE52_01285 [Tabrizicola sp.]|jgi:hypothetical protein|nr:hypothetical protein [Tabrizicola sp.]